MELMILLFETVLSLSLTSTYAQRLDVSALPCRLSQSAVIGSHNEGRLEVYYKPGWRPVCDETFGDDEARVVCLSLGYGNCGRVVSNSYGPAETPVLRLNIRCDGRESSLGECRYRVRSNGDAAAAHHCTHSSNYVAVECGQCHATTRRSRRNPIVPYNANSDTSSSSSGSSTFWMGGLFIFFFFAWVVVVICCILCHCFRRRTLTSESASPSQNIFMTSASGVDNPTMSTSQPDAVPLAGLPSYEEVIRRSDIYKRVDEESCLPSYNVAVGQQSNAQERSDNQTEPTSS